MFCPPLVLVLIRVQPAGGVIVGVPLEACAAIVATMTSLACVPGVPEGLPRLSDVTLLAVPLLIITAGIFFSFSRGAWGMFAVSAVLLTGCLFLQSASGMFRLRIVVMTIAAAALLVIAVFVILQLPGVSDMFTQRAHLEQSYDTARLGRFARYTIGFQMALEHPFGIGPLVFGTIFGEDTHDIWLKALMDYGWLGFVSFLTLTLWTITAGFRILLRDRPWQPYLLCAYVACLGNIGLGTFIDIDHWRHLYLLLGLIWGAIALEYRHQKELRLARPVLAPAISSVR